MKHSLVCSHTLSPGSTWPWGPSSLVAHGHVSSTHRLQEGAWNGLQWEWAKQPGWGPRLFSCHLWAPKDWNLIWSRNSGLWFLSWTCWGHSRTFSMVRQRDLGHRKPRRQFLCPHRKTILMPHNLPCVGPWDFFLYDHMKEPNFHGQQNHTIHSVL